MQLLRLVAIKKLAIRRVGNIRATWRSVWGKMVVWEKRGERSTAALYNIDKW